VSKRKKLHYQPLEVEVSQADFDAQSNPPTRRRLAADFRKMEIKLAIVRPAGWKHGPKLTSAVEVAALAQLLSDEVQETFYVAPVNTQLEVVGFYLVAKGSLAAVEVTPADVLRAVLVAGMVGFMCIHNHPSGSPEPSDADLRLTKRLLEAAKCVGCQLFDHVIVGHDGYVSLADRGVL